jgi:hypothetical protein
MRRVGAPLHHHLPRYDPLLSREGSGMDASNDWKVIFAGVSAIAAVVSAAVAITAAVVATRRNALAQQLAERQRQHDTEVRQTSLRRKLEAALIQLHMEMNTAFNRIRNTANAKPRPKVTAKELRLSFYYIQRIFDLESEVDVLPATEQKTVSDAVELVREYQAYIAAVVPPESDADPFDVPGFGMTVGPLLSRAYYATRTAINHYRPELKIADL